MQGPAIAHAAAHQILPVHDVALDGPKGHAGVVLGVAVHEGAPALIPRRIQHGEVGSAACNVGDTDVAEEGTRAVSAERGRRVLRRVGEPVGVEVVVLAGAVLDELDGLEV